jgi:hypothetical protein
MSEIPNKKPRDSLILMSSALSIVSLRQHRTAEKSGEHSRFRNCEKAPI